MNLIIRTFLLLLFSAFTAEYVCASSSFKDIILPKEAQQANLQKRVTTLLINQAKILEFKNLPPLFFTDSLSPDVIARYEVKNPYNFWPHNFPSASHCIWVNTKRIPCLSDQDISIVLGHELVHAKERHNQIISYSPVVLAAAGGLIGKFIGLKKGFGKHASNSIGAITGMLSAMVGPRCLEHAVEYRADVVSANANASWDQAINLISPERLPRSSFKEKLLNFSQSDRPLHTDRQWALEIAKKWNKQEI